MTRSSFPSIAVRVGGSVALTMLAGIAPAQDYIPGTNPMDIANTTSAYMNTHINNITLENMTRGGSGRSKGAKTGAKRGTKLSASPMRIAVMPASTFSGVKMVPAGAASLSYAPTAAIRAEAKRAFVARITRMNPAVGAKLGPAMKSFDMFAEFPKMIGDEGFKSNNVGDALAACLVGAWAASKGKLIDPNDEGERVIRSRIATALTADPRMKSAAFRQKLGDELQLMTVFILSGYAAALQADKGREYGAAMAALFQGMTGTAPNRLALTAKGFVPA